MSKAVGEIAAGAGLVALAVVAPELSIAIAPAIESAILATGASLVMSGIGTLLTKQQQGLSGTVANSIQPWNIIYGQAKVGGTVVFFEETGTSDKYLHQVFVLAHHPSNAVTAFLLDNKRVPLDVDGNSISFNDSTMVIGTQQTVNITSITRVGDLVTVVMAGAMTAPASTFVGDTLATGDTVQIQNVTTDLTLNGQFVIQLINPTTFEFTNGGTAVSISGQGQVVTTWPDYGDTVHLEIALGTQSSTSAPFPGLIAGGDTGSQGIWTTQCYLGGCTAAYLRLKYGGNTYASGIPSIGFIVEGKNDILDPRSGARGYTANSALCIADHLTNQTWGFKLNYGTEVPYPALNVAANISDEEVLLANGSAEARYTVNGSFKVNAKRGEILQNLLTSCGGRLTYSGGQYAITPAGWLGTSVIMGTALPANGSGSPLTSAVLTVWATWSPDSTAIATPRIQLSTGVQLDTSTLSSSLSTLTYTFSGPNLYQTFALSVTSQIEGTLGDTATSPSTSTLDIYDCYIFATYADASTATVRPQNAAVASGDNTGHGLLYSGLQGVVTNAGNAFDADSDPPVTFASIVRDYYNSLSPAAYIELNAFAFAEFTTSPTPIDTSLTYAAGPFQWKPAPAIRDLYNGVKATYICPANSWQASDMPPYAQDTLHGYSGPAEFEGDANLAADGGDRRWFDMQFPFTISAATAQRLAKIELLRRRQFGTGTFVYNLALMQCTALDIISMTLPYLGWTDKLLEITAHRFTVQKISEGAIQLGTEIDVQETASSVYDWSSTEELNGQGYSQANPPNMKTPTIPGSVAAVSGSGVAAVGADGVSTSQIQVTWTTPADGYVTQGGSIIVQYQVVGASTWTALGNFPSTTTTAYIQGVTDGQTYNVQVASVNAAGAQSNWVSATPVVASGGSLDLSLHRVDNETPSGAYDGVNQTYVLSQVPDPALSLCLYFNGILQLATVDFTLSGDTVTLLIAHPDTSQGDFLRANFWF